MTDKLQIQSIHILNSKYRILFTLLTYGLVYWVFYSDKTIVFCMNETGLPSIAEAKPSRNITRSIIQREVSSFLDFAERLEEQKNLISQQQKEIKELRSERDMYFSWYQDSFTFTEKQIASERELRTQHAAEIERLKTEIENIEITKHRIERENEALKRGLKNALTNLKKHEKNLL